MADETNPTPEAPKSKRGGARPGAGRKKKVVAPPQQASPQAAAWSGAAPNANPDQPRFQVDAHGKYIFDIGQVLALSTIGCTEEEIAAFFGVHENTIKNHKKSDPVFADACTRGLGRFKISIRRKLFGLADTQAGPAIFLAKNYLGMKDVVDTRHSGSVDTAPKQDLTAWNPDDLMQLRRLMKKNEDARSNTDAGSGAKSTAGTDTGTAVN